MDPCMWLLPLSSSASVMCLGGALLLVHHAKQRALEARLTGGSRGGSGQGAEPPLLPILKRFGDMASKEPSSKLRREIMTAGFYHPHASTIYLGIKVCLLMAGAGIGLVAGPLSGLGFLYIWMGTLLLAGTLFFLPNIYVGICRRQRTDEIRRHVPDMVDLYQICVSGGMGLDAAWLCVSDQIRMVSPLLADEMTLVNLEIHLGEERGNAIRHMADRTGATELASLVAVLAQAQRFGTSVTDALTIFASNMRELRSQRAEESAEKMSVQMIFPMVLLIFPVVIIIAVGPAGITMARILGN